MAAVNVTISGVLADKYGRTVMPCTLFGEMSYTGLGVGGGPIIPPGGGQPPSDAHPEHPIYIPEPPPSFTPPGDKPPPADGGWGYYDGKWGYFPSPGEASPKA